MKKLIIIAFMALMMTSCCECNRYEKKYGVELNKTVWQLTQLYGRPVEAAEDAFTVIFDGAKVNGRGACNSFFGDVALQKESGGTLRFSNMGSTQMMCPNQEMEDKFMEVLSTTDSFNKEGEFLYLFTDGELRAILRAQKAE